MEAKLSITALSFALTSIAAVGPLLTLESYPVSNSF